MNMDFEMTLKISNTQTRLEIREEGEVPRVALNTRDILNINAALGIIESELRGFALRQQRKAAEQAQPKPEQKAVKKAKKKAKKKR